MVVNGVDIEVERKPIKNLHLAVYPPDGRVHVSAPQSYTDEQIKLFVLKKWVWPMTRYEQMSIASVFRKMDEEISALEIKREKFTAIKQGMMQQLLTGKIRLID